jgi:hypothetical protein
MKNVAVMMIQSTGMIWSRRRKVKRSIVRRKAAAANSGSAKREQTGKRWQARGGRDETVTK